MPGHPGQALSPDGGPAVTAAAVWLRVSTGHQDSGNQVPDLERFTAHHGYDVAETYTVSERDGTAARMAGRPSTLKRALDNAHAGKFSVIVVWALDRITREGAEGALRIIREFRERGCTVVSVKESWLNGSPRCRTSWWRSPGGWDPGSPGEISVGYP